MVDAANSEFYSANVSSLRTDFNVTPYYDDFDIDKNYYRILFKPGFAVQARELTQIQSILQNQIQTFGQHLFKEGSAVLGGKFSISKRVAYVKVNDKDSFNADVDITKYKDQYITGQTSGIQAYVNLVLDGVQTSQNTKTLYLTYLNSSSVNGNTVFDVGETLSCNAGTLVVNGNTAPTANVTGVGTVFTINEGVRFAKEHFIHHPKSSVVVDRYGSSPTCKVGFLISEDIINASQDSSLLDPALESSNFAAPGADRFKLTPELTRLEVNEVAQIADYVNLFVIRDGVIQELNERPTYNVIRDEIAKRTADESGDYYVRGLNVNLIENLNTANNDGYLTDAQGGNRYLLTAMVEPGLGYVKGYEVENLASKYLTIEKAQTYSNVVNQVTTARLGSYVYANNFVGSWDINTGASLNLYDIPERRIVNGTYSTGALNASSKLIGTARLKSVVYDNGTLGKQDGSVKIHMFDVQMLGSNSFANVRTVLYDTPGSTANGVADVILDSITGECKLQEMDGVLLYDTGNPAIRTIRSDTGTVSMSFTFRKTEDITIGADGTFSVTSPIASELFPYTSSGTPIAISSSDKRDIILTINEDSSNLIPGTVSAGAGTTTLTGSGASKFLYLNVGDKIQFTGDTSNTYFVQSIASDTSLTVDRNLYAFLSGNTISKIYKKGDVIDLTTKGTLGGTTRAVTSSDTTLNVTLYEDFGGASKGATISYNLVRSTAREVAKTLYPSRYVKINVASYSSTTGPFNLGIADVTRIRGIYKKSTPFSAASIDLETNYTDVTELFDAVTGQEDDFYGYAKISPVATSLANTDWLAVELDYYVPDFTQGVGYFSVDSYPVNDVSPTSSQIRTENIPLHISPTNGMMYDLRNYLDFRPVAVNYANSSTNLVNSTVVGQNNNPTTFNYSGYGLRIPAESEQMTFDYSYYLPRLDVVAVNKDGIFSIVSGKPSAMPIAPSLQGDLMGIATLYISEYPSLSLTYARQQGRLDLACAVSRRGNLRYTMRDIGVLKSRIDSLEKYVSLNILEKSAIDLKITDENGLDRFKNGIFTDTFSDLSLSTPQDPDFAISIDPFEKSIRPLYEAEAIAYELSSNSSGTMITGDLATLKFTETTLIDQPYATTFRNVETTVFRFAGSLFLNPDKDFWTNQNRLSSVTIPLGNPDVEAIPYSVSYGSWTTSTGGWNRAWNATSSSGSIHKNWNRLAPALAGLSTTTPITYVKGGLKGANLTGSALRGSIKKGTATSPKGYLNTIYKTAPPDPLSLKGTSTTLGNFVVAGKGIQKTNVTWNGLSYSDLYAVVSKSRTMTETFQEVVTDYGSQGDKLVDVAPIADIRPQTIGIHGVGLKKNTKHFIFFDGQDMSDYCTPIANDPNVSPDGLIPYASDGQAPGSKGFGYIPIGAEGTAVYSDNTGNLYAVLRLPSDGTKTFRTGTKEVVVTDSPTNEVDATSSARSYFVAQGIQTSVQETITATKRVVTKNVESTQKGDDELIIYDRFSCMAYSFTPKCPNGEEGVFLSSVDVFFAEVDPVLGIWFEIREMDNSGNITRTQVPGSEVWLRNTDCNLSDDGSVATNVQFISPIFLKNDTEYAFVIHTQGLNPNYYMYVSVLGQKDLITQRDVNERGLTGNLYTTNNNKDWDIVQRVDLKCKFYRAKFQTGTETIVLKNGAMDFLIANTVASPLETYGEIIYGDDILTLSNITGGSISAFSNVLVGSTSTINATVLSTSSGYSLDNTGFIVGETVVARKANTYATTGVTATISSIDRGEAYLYNYRYVYSTSNDTVKFIGTNGKFRPGQKFYGNTSLQTGVVQSVDKFTYATMQFEPAFLTFDPTFIGFEVNPRNNDESAGSYQDITPGEVVYFNTEKAIFSKFRENTIGDSNLIKITMSSTSDYLSPVVDLSSVYSVYIKNLINSNTSGEVAVTGGALKNKYISQVVTLAEGQDAEDLNVILSAYRPSGSNCDIKVYCKISNAEDFESIADRTWIEMDYYNSDAYSSGTNRNDFREYTFILPPEVLVGSIESTPNVASYVNSAGTTFVGFRQFQIKIGLQSDSSAIYPRVSDLRAIALQK